MKLTNGFLALFLNLSLVTVSFLSLTNQTIFAQDSRVALQRGYRTGYSDGYMSGYRDALDNNAKNIQKHGEYIKADRAFNKDYGSLEDYRDGYRQGFESGYGTGFEKRSFDAAIPADLSKRGVAEISASIQTAPPDTIVQENPSVNTVAETAPVNKAEDNVSAPAVEVPTNSVEQKTSENVAVETTNTNSENTTLSATPAGIAQVNYTPGSGDIIIIPIETELIVELIENLNTELNREGDKFTARVFSPNEINGAIIEGRIAKIQKPGRIKRRAEMSLSFDRIVLPENRWSNFNAILTEVLPIKGDNVKRVDTEGIMEGKSSVKGDSAKVGATTGSGLVIGAIAAGPVGAAVGAGVGAAVGVTAVVVERGKHIRLNKNQQLRIKTAYETQIR